MVDYTTDAIYLGNFGDIDDLPPDFILTRFTVGSASDPISASHVTTITYNDNDNNGLIEENTGETITYSLDGGEPIVSQFDNTAVVTISVSYTDGTPTYIGPFFLSQAADGSVFIIPFSEEPIGIAQQNSNMALAAGPIEALEVITFISGNLIIVDGEPVFADADSGSQVVPSGDINILCFTKGTKILTVWGEKPIEQLAKGDIIITKYDGPQILRWIGSTTVPAIEKFAPIMIKAGALDNRQDLLVSPQHRMLIEGWKPDFLFGEPEVLVAAKHLVNGDTIYVSEGGTVEYFHLLFDTHQIIFSHGAASESFHLGKDTAYGMANETREEILALFPQLRDDMDDYGPSARASLKKHEAMVLIQDQVY